METLNNDIQIIAVKKVLEEMQKAEEVVNDWNVSWWEQCLDAYSMSLYYTGMADVQDIEKKYYNQYILPNVYYPENRIGEPLRKVILVDCYGKDHECEFGRIDWYGMKSHKSTRHFSFNNNGIIEFSKDSEYRQTIQHPKRISYKASFNVLSTDFNVSITLDELTQDWREKYKYDHLSISLNENIITKRFNNIEIIQDLNTGMKSVKIIKKYNKTNRPNNNTSLVFEALLNTDDGLQMCAVSINTHKGNGKINGTYRFDISRKKGIRANFYSRKGIKIDLTTNPTLLETANTLLPTLDSQNSEDIIISTFINSIQNAIEKNSSEKVISFDNFDFITESLKQVEDKTIEMIKCIKGEIPLPGLIERINNCLYLIDRQDSQKKLKLKSLDN